jgi:hypothetical protein
MIVKKIVTAGLLLFVAVSLGVLGVDLIRQGSPAQSDGAEPPSPPSSGPRTIVYFFHVTTRCPTCRAIEAHTRETLEIHFADELARGEIEWQVVDYQAAGKEHFRQQFELVTSTVVLAEGRSWPPKRWTKLPYVWDYANDSIVFYDYVQKELHGFLHEGQ